LPINYTSSTGLAVSTTISQFTFSQENSNFLIIPLSIQNGNGLRICVTYQLKVDSFQDDLPFKSGHLKDVAYFIQNERGKACQNTSTNGSPMNKSKTL
jgi:hypothetical protein